MRLQLQVYVFLLSCWMQLTACKTTGPLSGLSSESLTSRDTVIVQCLATQGNGANWPATMAWISETVRLRAEEAEARIAPGAQVYLDLACMAGGSSGSVMTNVYAALQSNPKLFPNRRSDSLWTPEEAKRLADALRWMALSGDAGALEFLNTLRQVINENIENIGNQATQRFARMSDFFARALGGRKPNWWNGQTVEGDQVLVDYVVLVQIASTLGPEQLNTAAAEPGARLIDLPSFPDLTAIPQNSPEAQALDRNLEARSKKLNGTTDRFVSGQFALGAFKARYLQGVYPQSSNLLRTTAEQALSPGFCTITMGAIYQRESDIPLDRLPYRDLRPFLFCDQATIQAILANESYRRESATVGSYGQRFILMQVANRRGSMAMSIREPRMMSELYGPMGQGRLEITGYYDPRIMSDFKVQAPQDQLAIAGGWPDRRVTALGLSYFAESRMRDWLDRGVKVEGFLSTFGKPDSFRQTKFDSVAIRELFSEGDSAETNLQDWFEFQDAYCDQRLAELSKIGMKTETVTFNWDIASLPASFSGVSRLLVYKGINAARLQGLTGRRDLVFDPDIKRGGDLPQGLQPCR